MLFTVAALFCSCLAVQNVWAKESVWSVGRTLLLLLLLPLLLLAGKSLSHTHTRARAHSFSHAHSLCTGTTAESRLPPSKKKKALTAGEVWRPSIVRRSRAGSAGKLGPIHTCTRARTEARVCSLGFILPLPSHPCAIPPSILNPLLCTSVRGAHSSRSIQPRARKKTQH